MTPALYAASVWLHVVAATAWVGSMIFFSTVLVPLLRRGELGSAAPEIIARLGKRYRSFGWFALTVLLITGASNLYFRGVGLHVLASGEFWATSFGRALAWKLGFVAIVVVLTAAHGVGARNRRLASWLGRALLLASLAILFFATALVRGLL